MEQRAMITSLFDEGFSGPTIHIKLTNLFHDHALYKVQVCNSVRGLRNGRTNRKDAPRSNRTADFLLHHTIRDILNDDQCLSVRDIAGMVG
jgi:hypothetical protein